MKSEKVFRNGDYVIFTDNEQSDCKIPVRDLNSPYWIAEWFSQVSKNSWVTKRHLVQFASIIRVINGGK